MKVVDTSSSGFLLILVLLLSACTSSDGKQAPEPVSDLSLAYSRLGSVQAGVVTSELELSDLIREFDRHDDTYGAWLATFELCRYNMRLKTAKRGDAVCDEALRRAKLSGTRSAVFTTAIQLYFYRGDTGDLKLAQDYANREQDRQVLALARGEYRQLELPEDEHPQLAVRAYQYYWYGKQHSDEAALELAYQLFLETDNPRGLADVQFLRARLAADRGDTERARELANRSLQVLGALGEQKKQRQVQVWINDELASR